MIVTRGNYDHLKFDDIYRGEKGGKWVSERNQSPPEKTTRLERKRIVEN